MDAARDRVALLVVRVWVEPGTEPPAIRARLTATEDLSARGSESTIGIAADVEEICDYVRLWLAAFIAG